MKVRLINQRGRVIEIDKNEKEVSQLLKQGFMFAPNNIKTNYNQVYDRGAVSHEPAPVKAEASPNLGDFLAVIKV